MYMVHYCQSIEVQHQFNGQYKMDVGMDTGDMILKKEVEIGEDETTGELWNRLSKIGGELLVQTLEQIKLGTAPRTPQGNDFTMAPMLNKEIAKIDWINKTAIEIKNLIRGLNPIMGAYSFENGKKIKFWKVQVVQDNELELDIQNKKLGEVILSNDKKGLFIKAKDGIISVLEIQGENAKRMNIGDFLRGNKIDLQGSELIPEKIKDKKNYDRFYLEIPNLVYDYVNNRLFLLYDENETASYPRELYVFKDYEISEIELVNNNISEFWIDEEVGLTYETSIYTSIEEDGIIYSGYLYSNTVYENE